MDAKAVEEVIEALLEGRDDEDEPTEIISAFESPKYSYDPIKRAFWRYAQALVLATPVLFNSLSVAGEVVEQRLAHAGCRPSRRCSRTPSRRLRSTRSGSWCCRTGHSATSSSRGLRWSSAPRTSASSVR